VITGLMNKIGVQILRVSPRRIPPKIVRALHGDQ
jgi:hypothetical protein